MHLVNSQSVAPRLRHGPSTGSKRAPSQLAAAVSPDQAATSAERYMARGVSAAKEDVHAAIKKIDKVH